MNFAADFDADAFAEGIAHGKAALPEGSRPFKNHTTTARYKAALAARDSATTAADYWFAAGEMIGLGEAGARRSREAGRLI